MIRLAARNASVIDDVRRRTAPLWTPRQRLRAVRDRNTRGRNRRDIAAHYDLGDELFERMLDPTMMYSCALFEHAGMTLEQASLAKLERICDQLALGPDDHLVEIGTGWGSLAIHAAATRGCRVTTTTISRDQHAYATRRVAEAGLADRVRVLLSDYRDLRGSYDKLVSVEMIEAVGWQQIGTLLRTLLGAAARARGDAPAGDHDRRPGLRGREGIQVVHQGVHLSRRLPAVDGGDHAQRRAPHRPAGDRPARTSARAMSRRCATGARTSRSTARRSSASATTSASSVCGRCTSSYCEGGFAERRICDVQLLLAKPQWAAHGGAQLRSATVASAQTQG